MNFEKGCRYVCGKDLFEKDYFILGLPVDVILEIRTGRSNSRVSSHPFEIIHQTPSHVTFDVDTITKTIQNVVQSCPVVFDPGVILQTIF